MNAYTRKKLAAATQVLAFMQAHPDPDPSYAPVVAKLQDAVTRGNALAIQQRDGTAGQRAATVQRKAAGGALRTQLRHLARVASIALADHPEWQAAFALPRSWKSYEAVLTSAKSMQATVTADEATLVGLGLGSTFVADLTTAITTFDTITAGGAAARQGHVGARVDLGTLGSEIVHLTRVLNGLNSLRFRGDAELLAEWRSAMKVMAGGKGAPEKAAPAPAPANERR